LCVTEHVRVRVRVRVLLRYRAGEG
jgi:hypothetical protein